MKTPSAVPHQYSITHENSKIKQLFHLIIYMNRSYSDYINIIDEVDNIEQVIITDNKIKKMLLLFIRINQVRNSIYQK